MAITLSKFGVPVGGQREPILQPKLKYRFRVISTNFGPAAGGSPAIGGTPRQLELTKQIMNATKPKISQEEVQLDTYISRAWVAGKHIWEPITLVVRDDITNAVSKLVGHQLSKQVNHFEQTSPAAGINYKFRLDIDVLDGGNVTVQEKWSLEGCWLQNVDYDSLDYSTSDVQMITMTVRFDNAIVSGLFGVDDNFIQSQGNIATTQDTARTFA